MDLYLHVEHSKSFEIKTRKGVCNFISFHCDVLNSGSIAARNRLLSHGEVFEKKNRTKCYMVMMLLDILNQFNHLL